MTKSMLQPGAAEHVAASLTRVLLVDDSQDDVMAMAFELGRGLDGLETRWAEGETRMYELIEQWQPHIVLIDVHMPRFNVFAALAHLRTAWPLLPVVVVSGLVGEEVAVRLIKAGAKDFVAKAGLARLPMVVQRELREAATAVERVALQARLRNQENLFQRVLEHLPLGLWLVDQAGALQQGNPAGQAIWEGARYAGLADMAEYKAWWPDSGLPVPPERRAAVRAFRNGETVLNERIEIETFRGNRRVILTSAVPLQADDGAPQGCFIVNQDITELHQTEQRLRRTERLLRALSQRLVDAQEQERRWIAQELHDDIGQGIAAMRFQLARIVERCDDAAARALAADALNSSEQLNDRLRQICLGLRPLELDDFGLMAALRSLLASLGHRPALDWTLDCDGPERRYPAALETAAFRIGQEAINNALRHSGCTALAVRVQAEVHQLTLSVHDDGCGFAPDRVVGVEIKARQLGLIGMEERAHAQGGRLQIESAPGGGTTVSVVLPVPVPVPAHPAADSGSAT